MQYKVIVEDAARGLMGDSGMETSAAILSEKVNEAIKDGWEPLGGIAHSENRQENPFLLQAMINRSPIPAVDAEEVPSPAPPEA
ncbi:MAG: DUF1737 domain-containing protein [Opitutales bacterium]|nr:DUF1737 domain-containing protein [Opitutales bacterium]